MRLNLFTTAFVITLAIATSPATAQINYSGTLSVEDLQTNIGNDFRYTATLSDPSPGPFTADFSPAGGETLTIQWNAPVGKQIEIAIPAGIDEIETANVLFETTGPFGGSSIDASAWTFNGLVGPPIDVRLLNTGTISASGDYARVRGRMTLTPGQTYRFDSITADLSIPELVQGEFTALPVDHFNISIEIVYVNDPGGSPGQFVSIVPEPTSLALLGLGGVLIARRR